MNLLPQNITAGLTFRHEIKLPHFRAPDWSLVLLLRGPSAIDVLSVPAADGTSHLLQAPASVTADWAPGAYTASLRRASGADLFEVEALVINVVADITTLEAGHDPRSHAQRVLDSINAVIEGRATKDEKSYRINNRELHRTPMADLLKLQEVYRARVRRERNKGMTGFGRPIRHLI